MRVLLEVVVVVVWSMLIFTVESKMFCNVRVKFWGLCHSSSRANLIKNIWSSRIWYSLIHTSCSLSMIVLSLPSPHTPHPKFKISTVYILFILQSIVAATQSQNGDSTLAWRQQRITAAGGSILEQDARNFAIQFRGTLAKWRSWWLQWHWQPHIRQFLWTRGFSRHSPAKMLSWPRC